MNSHNKFPDTLPNANVSVYVWVSVGANDKLRLAKNLDIGSLLCEVPGGGIHLLLVHLWEASSLGQEFEGDSGDVGTESVEDVYPRKPERLPIQRVAGHNPNGDGWSVEPEGYPGLSPSLKSRNNPHISGKSLRNRVQDRWFAGETLFERWYSMSMVLRLAQIQCLHLYWINRRCPSCGSSIVSLHEVPSKGEKPQGFCQDCSHQWFVRGDFKYRVDDAQKFWIPYPGNLFKIRGQSK